MSTFWANALYADAAETSVSTVQLAFQARSEADVRAFHAAWHRCEPIWHGLMRRSAESVQIVAAQAGTTGAGIALVTLR